MTKDEEDIMNESAISNSLDCPVKLAMASPSQPLTLYMNRNAI